MGFRQVTSIIDHTSLSVVEILERLKVYTSSKSFDFNRTDSIKSTSELLDELQINGVVTRIEPSNYRLTSEQMNIIRSMKLNNSKNDTKYAPSIHVGKIATDTSCCAIRFYKREMENVVDGDESAPNIWPRNGRCRSIHGGKGISGFKSIKDQCPSS